MGVPVSPSQPASQCQPGATALPSTSAGREQGAAAFVGLQINLFLAVLKNKFAKAQELYSKVVATCNHAPSY